MWKPRRVRCFVVALAVLAALALAWDALAVRGARARPRGSVRQSTGRATARPAPAGQRAQPRPTAAPARRTTTQAYRSAAATSIRTTAVPRTTRVYHGQYGSVRQSSAHLASSRTARSARTVQLSAADRAAARNIRDERRDLGDDVRDAREDFWEDNRRERRYLRYRAGTTVYALPRGYTKIYVETEPYYYYDGVYYESYYTYGAVTYAVIDAPVGAVIWELPEGYEVIEAEGVTYYVFNGVYYKQVYYEGQVVYMVVKPPM